MKEMQETIKFTPDVERIKKIKLFMKEGHTVRCLVCGTCYKKVPSYFEEQASCMGARIDCCRRCGSDLLMTLQEVLDRGVLKIEVSPIDVDGVPTLIFKEFNFKYCTCSFGEHILEVHAGDVEFECGKKWGMPEIKEKRTENSRTFVCPQKERQDYHIIILKSTPEERKQLKNPYMQSLSFIDWDKK